MSDQQPKPEEKKPEETPSDQKKQQKKPPKQKPKFEETKNVSKEPENKPKVETDVVTPWDVEAEDEKGIDYDKLIKKFGSDAITDTLIKEVERLTNAKPHRFLRRGIFFSHRELGIVLSNFEKK